MNNIAQVYEEPNYDAFRRLYNNREVTQGRIDKLVTSFKKKDILNPIIVNEKMEIIDGQGRYEARKNLGLPIQFIIVPGIGGEECKLMNRFNSNWTLVNYIEANAKDGNENYIRVLDTAENAYCSVLDVLRFTSKLAHCGVKSESSKTTHIEDGRLIFTEEDAKLAENIANHVREMKKALDFKKRFNETFKRAIAITYTWDGYSPKRMVNNCEFKRESFVQPSNLKDMLAEFERIYNYRGREKLYFTDFMRNKGSNVRDYSKTEYTHKNSEDKSTLKPVKPKAVIKKKVANG